MLALKLFLLVFICTPFALVSIAAWQVQRERRAVVSAVRRLVCPSCNAELSERSLHAADALWQRHMSTLMKENPIVMFRMLRRLAAVCEACGVRLQFDQKTLAFKAMTIVLAFEADDATTDMTKSA